MSRRRIVVPGIAVLRPVTGVIVVLNLPNRPATTVAHGVIPAPVAVTPAPGVTFTLGERTAIHTAPGAEGAGAYLADLLRPPTGLPLPVHATGAPGSGSSTGLDGGPGGGIWLLLSGPDPAAGDDGYQMDVTAGAVVIRAGSPAGLFAGIQTLRQSLPPEVEGRTKQPGPWTVPGGRTVDRPRFAYRGAMLDVARHFFGVDDVLRFIDYLALYKINYLHLHLTDDQGWRIAIDRWPRLATHGGSTQVGGGAGGYYTKAQYQEIVAYARRHFITVVPEIDLPGHTNAALSAYPELACDGKDRPLYTGTAVGFSAVCPDKSVTYDFVRDVLAEIAALTPGPYLHIGGDEAETVPATDYAAVVDCVVQIVYDG